MNVSSATKFFPTAQDNFVTTTTGTVASGASSVSLNSTGSYSNGDVVVMVIEPGITGKQTTFTGIIDTAGIQVTNVVWTEGYTAVSHSSGVTVMDYVCATHLGLINKGMLVEHNQDGTHKLGSSSTLTSTKLITGLTDTNGKKILDVSPTASAVNELQISNAATNNAPSVAAVGTDSNIPLNLGTKGSGVLQVNGSQAGPQHLKNNYKFAVYHSGAQTLGTSATKVHFDTKEYDTGTNFDNTTNYRFTAPVAGFYSFHAKFSVAAASTATQGACYLYKNGSLVKTGSKVIPSSTQDLTCEVSANLQLAANDYIEVYSDSSAHAFATLGGAANDYFMGHMISAV